MDEVGFTARHFLNHVNKFAQQNGFATAEIEHLVSQRLIQSQHHPIGNILHKRPVAVHFPIFVQGGGVACADAIRHQIGHHVGTAVGAIDGEEAHGREIQPKQMVIGMAEDFSGAFGGRIGLERLVARIRLYKWDLRGVPIHRRSGSQHKIVNFLGAGGIHQMLGGVEINFHIQLGVQDGVAHARHCRQMGHRVELFLLEYVEHALAVANIRFYHAEVGVSGQPGRIGPLFGGVVIVVEVVQPHDFIPPLG